MSTVADRTRAAMDAITSQVYDAPPLRLPPPPAPAPRRRCLLYTSDAADE